MEPRVGGEIFDVELTARERMQETMYSTVHTVGRCNAAEFPCLVQFNDMVNHTKMNNMRRNSELMLNNTCG